MILTVNGIPWPGILYDPAFLIFYKYWPDDGLIRLKLVANIWNNKIKRSLWQTEYIFWYDMMIWHICELQLGWHPLVVVLYTFTHKQYIGQPNEREYTEQNIHNNKNI